MLKFSIASSVGNKKPAKQRFMIWSKQPEITVHQRQRRRSQNRSRRLKIAGRMWFSCLTNNQAQLPSRYGTRITSSPTSSGKPAAIDQGQCEKRVWQLTKVERSSTAKTKPETIISAANRISNWCWSLVGQPSGPTEAEGANAKKTEGLIGQLNYPHIQMSH